MRLQTEFEFTLPRGYVDEAGNVHQRGVMRLATAMDEIAPLRDLRVRSSQAYLVIVLLSRVIVKLGNLSQITTDVMENLFAADLAYLQAFYRKINEEGTSRIKVECPECHAQFELDLATMGGVIGYPLDRLHEEVAYIAYHFHWPHEDILALEHRERREWVEQIAKINRRLNEAGRR